MCVSGYIQRADDRSQRPRPLKDGCLVAALSSCIRRGRWEWAYGPFKFHGLFLSAVHRGGLASKRRQMCLHALATDHSFGDSFRLNHGSHLGAVCDYRYVPAFGLPIEFIVV